MILGVGILFQFISFLFIISLYLVHLPINGDIFIPEICVVLFPIQDVYISSVIIAFRKITQT